MGQGFQFFDIIFFALVAGFIVLRLRRVLGTRTGHEKRPEDAMQRRGPTRGEHREDNVVRLPGADRNAPEGNRDGAEIVSSGSPASQALTEIQLADRTFDPHGFVDGATQAYEMIVVAFAQGDTQTLRPLVSDEVFENFASAIDARADEGHTMETQLVRMGDARIAEAELKDRIAEITVKFTAELLSCVKNADGAVVHGHPTVPQEVSELWTFSRDTASSNPNWTLIGTTPAE